MSEKELQHNIVKWFGQTYPEHRGLLFEVNNNTYSVRHGLSRISMGMVPGVSDLILIMPKCGKIAALELKAINSRHPINHIENQLDWGKKIIDNGGFYLMSYKEREIRGFMYHCIRQKYNCLRYTQDTYIPNIQFEIDLAKKNNKKTIVFK